MLVRWNPRTDLTDGTGSPRYIDGSPRYWFKLDSGTTGSPRQKTVVDLVVQRCYDTDSVQLLAKMGEKRYVWSRLMGVTTPLFYSRGTGPDS